MREVPGLESQFEGLLHEDKKDSFLEAIDRLISDEDVELKTEIKKPIKLAIFKSMADYLKKEGYTETAKIINNIIDNYLKYMVSHNRQSRAELVDSMKHLRYEQEQQKQSMMDRFLERQ